MSIIFIISLIVLLIFIPVHFLSVSHIKLKEKFGKEKGKTLGKILGMISGWGFFICLFGIWFSFQPRFYFPFFPKATFQIPLLRISISLVHVILSLPFILLSTWLGIAGVKDLSLEVSETHRANNVVDTGVYSKVRHPQYLGAILAHLGFSLLLSALFSLFVTPVIILYNYITAWKEEQELKKEFGEDYKKYTEKVPMFIPRVFRG
ncbi:MAG: isoprenylcysteine carboxylmethyltransferase family protein [Promethearchaeia archaeon]